MKQTIATAILMSFLSLQLTAQTPAQFTKEGFAAEILNYQPSKADGIYQDEYDNGVFFLEETKKATKNDTANFNVADYWNITIAFLNIGESPDNIALAFTKAIEADPSTICAYLESMGNANLDTIIPAIFNPFYAQKCLGQEAEVQEDSQGQNGDESELIALIKEISARDQMLRKGEQKDLEKQARLDLVNQALIDSLFTAHGSYIGRSMVGEDLEHVMWAVIQHSDIDMMERYLNIVHQAVQAEELSVVPLKMLLDRIETTLNGFQLFGSQAGVPLGPESLRERVAKQYGIDQAVVEEK